MTIMDKIKSPQDMNFLIVDDVDNMRRSIKAMLKLIRYGRQYYEAANGRDAWQFLQDKEIPIDFIIADYYMPHLSGTELLHLVRNNRETRDIPFLMITAEANMDIVAEAAEHEVDAYLTKPFVTATLEQKIKELLKKVNEPDPVTLHLRRARELEEQGDLAGAIKEAQKAAELNSNVSRPFRELGRLFVKKGDLKKGKACFEQAVNLNRLDVTSYHALGQIAFRQGQADKAIQFFARAMEISPRHSDRALNFAKLLLKNNKREEAEKVLRLVIRAKSSDIDFKEDVADTCTQFGLFDLAVKTYREVLKEDPERHYLRKKLGYSLAKSGDLKEGARMLEQAAEKFQEDIELLLMLARLYLEMKMPMRADNFASRVIRLDPQNEEAREILKKTL